MMRFVIPVVVTDGVCSTLPSSRGGTQGQVCRRPTTSHARNRVGRHGHTAANRHNRHAHTGAHRHTPARHAYTRTDTRAHGHTPPSHTVPVGRGALNHTQCQWGDKRRITHTKSPPISESVHQFAVFLASSSSAKKSGSPLFFLGGGLVREGGTRVLGDTHPQQPRPPQFRTQQPSSSVPPIPPAASVKGGGRGCPPAPSLRPLPPLKSTTTNVQAGTEQRGSAGPCVAAQHARAPTQHSRQSTQTRTKHTAPPLQPQPLNEWGRGGMHCCSHSCCRPP
jgi:hypothetical protein